MTHGNLEHTLTRPNYAPTCFTCGQFNACRHAPTPKHALFPHRWEWIYSGVDLPEGKLTILAWVGSTTYKEPLNSQQACSEYVVELDYQLPLEERHKKLLGLKAQEVEAHSQLRSAVDAEATSHLEWQLQEIQSEISCLIEISYSKQKLADGQTQ